MKRSANKENIFQVIYELVRAVPRGRVTTYGAIAAAIGAKSGARVVGYALQHCSGLIPFVPTHRVVNRFGALSAKHHYNPPEKMQQLLEEDGVSVRDDIVIDFKTIFWDPIKELLK